MFRNKRNNKNNSSRRTRRPLLECLEHRKLFATVPVSGGVPLLSSNPSATAKLYLDFDGAPAQTWGTFQVPTAPAYDVDGDPTTFNNTGDSNLHTEIDNIRQIWSWVAEKYSPFNVDVTTIDPGSYGDKQALRVLVGGDGSWMTTGGWSGAVQTGGFFNSSSNTAFTFSNNFAGAVNYVADTAAHIAARGFGLQLQSTYDTVSTQRTTYYNTGNSAIAPIMGTTTWAARGLWWNGTSSIAYYNPTTQKNVPVMQDDMALLAGTDNGFGYRNDDHGGTSAAATTLSNGAAKAGIIERVNDVDYFSFTTTGGQISINAAAAQYGAMLNLKFQVFNSSGQQVASADSATLGETLTTNLAAGTYFVAVSGHGLVTCTDGGVNKGSGYDVGQYTLTVNAPTGASGPNAPTNLTATGMDTGVIRLNWTDASSNETGFRIERSTNGGTSWSSVATVGANVTTFSQPPVMVGGVKYRVVATNSSGTSGYSNIATFNVVAGDANLDGVLNGDDYFQIDSNIMFQTQNPSWNKGDFNFDGQINGDDYFIIDSNIVIYK